MGELGATSPSSPRAAHKDLSHRELIRKRPTGGDRGSRTSCRRLFTAAQWSSSAPRARRRAHVGRAVEAAGRSAEQIAAPAQADRRDDEALRRVVAVTERGAPEAEPRLHGQVPGRDMREKAL